jgi:tRNA U34 5-methylaminomethyl-2-thiouridine-forming methyltransferase MnmC
MSTRPEEHLTDLQKTGDGSHTLYSHRFRQQYHDTNGAIDESRHVFFENSGLLQRLRNNEDVHILEMGFGTGLNLLLVADALQHTGSQSQVHYTSIEGYPISAETASQLNYHDHLNLNLNLPSIFSSSHPGLNSFQITQQLHLDLFIGLFEDVVFPDRAIDIIFFDAFSPKANPELWTSDVFRALYDHAHPGCVMSTYCAAVSARAAMCHAGWHVARGPGFKTRREMTVASNDPTRLEGLPRIDEQRYAQRYASGEFDAH